MISNVWTDPPPVVTNPTLLFVLAVIGVVPVIISAATKSTRWLGRRLDRPAQPRRSLNIPRIPQTTGGVPELAALVVLVGSGLLVIMIREQILAGYWRHETTTFWERLQNVLPWQTVLLVAALWGISASVYRASSPRRAVLVLLGLHQAALLLAFVVGRDSYGRLFLSLGSLVIRPAALLPWTLVLAVSSIALTKASPVRLRLQVLVSLWCCINAALIGSSLSVFLVCGVLSVVIIDHRRSFTVWYAGIALAASTMCLVAMNPYVLQRLGQWFVGYSNSYYEVGWQVQMNLSAFRISGPFGPSPSDSLLADRGGIGAFPGLSVTIGLVPTLVVVAAFVWLGMTCARSPRPLASKLGITVLLLLFLNLASATGVLPTFDVEFPFATASLALVSAFGVLAVIAIRDHNLNATTAVQKA